MSKYGFIYLWFDRKHRRFYLGSHWGREDDGYICSSRWMRKSYRRRPEDFKRRILVSGLASVYETQKEELRWLKMIKPEEIRQGKLSKYYNLAIRANVPPKPTQSSKQKQSDTMKKRYANDLNPWNKGVPHTAEANEKNRQAHLGKKLSDDARQAFIEAGRKAMETVTPEQKQEWYDAASKRFKGVPLSEDHKQKLSEAKQRQFADRPLPPGVYLDKRRPNAPRPYEARTMIDGKRKTIGMFATPEEASKAIRVQISDHKSPPLRSKS